MMFKFIITLLSIFVIVIAVHLKPLRSMQCNSSRIVGGNVTSITNVPYQVSIHVYHSFTCGGSIISSQWIVTAAHCSFYSLLAYTIRAGSTDYKVGGSSHNVVEIIIHKNYKFRRNGADIALMRVDIPFEFDQTRQPISLFNENEESIPGTMAIISGWGRTNPRILLILKLAQVPIVSKSQCNSDYHIYGGIRKYEICAGYRKGGTDSCQGDSGGPLVINNRLAGITSWGNGCAQPGFPGVYTEISGHRNWIKHYTGI